MARWLMKSEPDVFGYDDLERKAVEEWTGVRSFQARNNMDAMRIGDEAFFYHSNIGKQIVGIMKIVALAHPDSTASPNDRGDAVWRCVDVAAVRRLPRPVTLEQVRAEPRLADMVLVRNSRLSVQPVSEAEWALILEMGGL